MEYVIRGVRPADLKQAAEVEARCFPASEAASEEMLGKRIAAFPESFFVAEDEEKHLIGFINGCVTDERTIRDEMFEHPDTHVRGGAYQSIFGLDVVEEWRHRGVATALMERFISQAAEDGRRGMILTCKEKLIPFYEAFGYKNTGVSASVHGGEIWYDMILEF